jgi:diacylglycerol kinase (ATP)
MPGAVPKASIRSLRGWKRAASTSRSSGSAHRVKWPPISSGAGTRPTSPLSAAGLPMGILPMGTANDLARTLEIPTQLELAADIIIAGHQRQVDLGDVNGHPFFNVATIGLGADLAMGLTAETKRRWGRLGYAIGALKVLLQARPFSATISNREGRSEVKTYQIAVGNGRHYGGGTVIEQDASIEDGTLDLYSLEIDNVWKLALMLRAFRSGTHGAWEEVRTARCTEFDIRTRKPRPVNLDGDIVTQTPAHFRIRPGAITVFAPPAQPVA